MCYPPPNGHRFKDNQETIIIHNHIQMPSLVLNWFTVGWLVFVSSFAARMGWALCGIIGRWLTQ